ncbi:MAG: hypothetical protein ABSB95_15265, partial [Dissulfurispiraceae bacterium]
MRGKKAIALAFGFFCLVIFADKTFAGNVSETAAWQVAQNLMSSHVAIHGEWNGSASPYPISVELVSYSGEPVAYLVGASPSGSVLVAYYDDFSPVLFYSPGSTLNTSRVDDPNALESWLIPETFNSIQKLGCL